MHVKVNKSESEINLPLILACMALGEPSPPWSEAGDANGRPMLLPLLPGPPLPLLPGQELGPLGPLGVRGGVGLPGTGLCWKGTEGGGGEREKFMF